MSEISSKIKSGIIWSSASIFINIFNLFVITAILARILSPEDFGLMAVITTIIGFAKIFVDLGLSSAIIQKQKIDDMQLSVINNLNIISGFLLAILMYFIAPLISDFFGDFRLVNLIRLTSVIFLVQSFSMVYKAILQKKMLFKVLSINSMISECVKGVVSIICAVLGLGVYSLILGQIALNITELILLIIKQKNLYEKKIWVFSIKGIRNELRYSLYLVGFQITHYLGQNLDKIIIGKIAGTHALGLYTVVSQLIMIPRQNINPIITKVMFPALSSLQDDIGLLKEYHHKMMKYISFFTIPPLIGLFFLSEKFIFLVYGEKWLDAVVVLKIMCFVGIFRSLNSLQGNVVMAKGKTRFMFLNNMVIIPLTLLATLVVSYFGVESVAYVNLISSIISFLFLSTYIKKILKGKFLEEIMDLKTGVLSSILMLILLSIISPYIKNLSILNSFIIEVVIGILILLSYLLFFDKKFIKEILGKRKMKN